MSGVGHTSRCHPPQEQEDGVCVCGLSVSIFINRRPFVRSLLLLTRLRDSRLTQRIFYIIMSCMTSWSLDLPFMVSMARLDGEHVSELSFEFQFV